MAPWYTVHLGIKLLTMIVNMERPSSYAATLHCVLQQKGLDCIDESTIETFVFPLQYWSLCLFRLTGTADAVYKHTTVHSCLSELLP